MMPVAEQRANPYPGLKPFDESEAHLFFGRSEQVSEVVDQLKRSRFVAVVGASGSGKSSLVRAGVLPALHAEPSARAPGGWLVATLRPGGDPIRSLALAIGGLRTSAEDAPVEGHLVAQTEAALRRSGLGLADLANERTPAGMRLLVVVDQFEEIFRYASAGGDRGIDGSTAFVELLLEAARCTDCPVDVLLTMRSDFLGDCARFSQLPAAISDGLYLVPRLSRTQLREAITDPAAVVGGELAPRLVRQILNDAGTDSDSLPLVQHALARSWDLWAAQGSSGAVDIDHYELSGGVGESLARHGDELYRSLAGDRQPIMAMQMFRLLVETTDDGRSVRRPAALGEVAAVTDHGPEEVARVVDVFQQSDASFLTRSADDVIDISHEALIRHWPRLGEWIDDERKSADLYRSVARSGQQFADGTGALLSGKSLRTARRWLKSERPNEAWASRYTPPNEDGSSNFEAARNYVRKSARRSQARWAGAGVAGVLAAFGAVLIWQLTQQLEDTNIQLRDFREAVAVAEIQFEVTAEANRQAQAELQAALDDVKNAPQDEQAQASLAEATAAAAEAQSTADAAQVALASATIAEIDATNAALAEAEAALAESTAQSPAGQAASWVADRDGYSRPVLIPGNISLEVGWLQEALEASGFATGEDFVDCVFGPLTKTQVEAFQKDRDLEPDGVVTQEVWDQLGVDGPGYDDIPDTCESAKMSEVFDRSPAAPDPAD